MRRSPVMSIDPVSVVLARRYWEGPGHATKCPSRNITGLGSAVPRHIGFDRAVPNGCAALLAPVHGRCCACLERRAAGAAGGHGGGAGRGRTRMARAAGELPAI